MTWLVRVANAGLKVTLFSFSCGRAVRVARKRLTGQDPKAGAGRNEYWLTNTRNDSIVLNYCQGIVPEYLSFE